MAAMAGVCIPSTEYKQPPPDKNKSLVKKFVTRSISPVTETIYYYIEPKIATVFGKNFECSVDETPPWLLIKKIMEVQETD